MQTDTQHNLHGNLLAIHSIGVVLAGAPKIGKSELSLALIERGHQFVADDFIALKKENNKLIGYAPQSTYGFMHIPGIGFIDIQCLFPTKTILTSSPINLIIQLTQQQLTDSNTELDIKQQNILNITVPLIELSITGRKDCALLIDTLVTHYKLAQTGHDTNQKKGKPCSIKN